jgi:xanthine dehydrogenase accessory factor
MIGSKKKVATLKKELVNEKTLSEEQFNRINTPIGIGIACQTPEEIVVSILAKLVDVRASK